MHPFSSLAFTLSTAFAMILCGCISDQGSFNNITVSGHIRKATDSTVVPGALVIVNIDVLIEKSSGTYSDSSGYFEYRRTTPTYDWDPVAVTVTVADMDGEDNGVFISQDTTLYDDNAEGELNIDFVVEFYVQMVEDTTKSNPVPVY
ncbi:MAG: hypothetical protein GF388_02365 [Candidatus Aegiribacteria sp.]|nr:hypothetical protein [Candidatus Aegiribacteria sp.]